MRTQSSTLLVIALALAVPLATSAVDHVVQPTGGNTPVAVRSDFRIDQATDEGDALGPSISTDRGGNFIVTWLANGHVYARQFYSSGAPVAAQFQVDPGEPGVTVEYPRVVMRPDGDMAYLTYGREVDGDEHVMIRRYRPRQHRLVGMPVQMDSAVPNAGYPNLTIDPRGRRLGAVWITSEADDVRVPYFRTLTSSAKPIGAPVPLALRGSGTHGVNNPVYVTALGGENFMVAWTEFGPTDCSSGAFSEVVAQRVTAQGPLDGSFCVAQASIYQTPGLPVARYMAAAGCPDGRTLIAWTASYPDEYHVFARLYDTNGNAVTDETRVDQGEPAYEALVNHVTCDPSGVFTHTWLDNPHGGFAAAPRIDLQVYARRSGDTDIPFSEFRADSSPAGSVRLTNLPDFLIVPDVAASATNIVFVWVEWLPADSARHATIFASVFANPPGFDQ